MVKKGWLLLCVIGFLVWGVVTWQQQAAPASIPLNTWTIVALDPETGDVGIAGASCVNVKIDAIAALAPGQGVVTTQAAYYVENRDVALRSLTEGETAEEIVDSVLEMDEDDEDRQYGIVTLNDGVVHTASYTGEDVQAWAGSITDTQMAVSVQGNILEGEAVVADAYAAFIDPTLGDVHLADRLMRAVEAGSLAGGDTRCNQQDIQQTAASTFIMVARGGDAPYSVPSFGLTALTDPDAPWLALSVNNPMLSLNPIPELRTQYDAWRSENLPPCDDCRLESYSTDLPRGAEADQGRRALGFLNTFLSPIAIRLGGVLAVGIGMLVVIGILRQRRKL
jgi:uncharacterized Ntn-hydrolase superfamily protein